MNKQEIKAKIGTLEYRSRAIAEELRGLVSELSEAEKPKFNHGDFGIGYNKRPFVLTRCGKDAKAHMGNQDEEWWGENSADGRYFGAIRFGNIFDLMEDWDKDLKRANIDGFVIEICCDRVVIGGRRFLIEQAEEFWHKLGHLIISAKRKQSK